MGLTANLRSYLSGIAQANSLITKSNKSIPIINSITELVLTEEISDSTIEIDSSVTYTAEARLASAYSAPVSDSQVTGNPITLTLNDNSVFDEGDTILVQGVNGYNADGRVIRNQLMLFVVSKLQSNLIEVESINGMKIGTATNQVPDIDSGTTFLRCGRSGEKMEEEDMSNNEYAYVNNFAPNYTLNFCASLSESLEENMLNGVITPNSKMTKSELNLFEAYIEARERSFLWGVASSEYFTTGGIWDICKGTLNYDEDSLVLNDIITYQTYQTSYYKKYSDIRYIVCGPGIINLLIKSGEFPDDGILKTHMGKFKFVCLPTFNNMGYPDNGIIIDPLYIKYMVKSPLTATYDAENELLTISEESALILTEPRAATRIVMQ